MRKDYASEFSAPYDVAAAHDDRDAAVVQAIRQFMSGTTGLQTRSFRQKPE
jgi:hypothetical protein